MSYVKLGARISLLPLSQFCGKAVELSEAHGAGRAAAKSSAFHAMAADAPDAKEKWARLSPEEQAEIAGWKKPTDVTVFGYELTYEGADKEQPVGLTASGEWADDGEVVTCGTLDFAWVVTTKSGLPMVVIADMKKTRWASSGPDSLQLLSYGYAWAKKHGCDYFVTGIWLIEDAEWQWSETVHSVAGFDSLDLWERIKHAALNTSGEAAFGDHCSNCWGRLHCAEYTLPAAFIDTWLTPAAVGGAIDDAGKLGEMLSLIRRVEPLIEKAKEAAKEAVRRGVTVSDPATGELFKAVECQGRESLNQKALFEALPNAKQFVERGKPYTMMRWVKPGKAKVAK